jgi:Lrp/AsnC family transcriptional regulator, regulator for asnA, asnC and gidA
MDGNGELDRTDEAILSSLQEDGRRPFRQIARDLNLSERTIRSRVRLMQDAGVLRILAFVDPVASRRALMALVFLRVAPEAHDEVVEEVAGWAEVSYVSSLLGQRDVCLQVVCEDNDALWHLLNDRLRRLAGVRSSETLVEMKVHKFDYRLRGRDHFGPSPQGGAAARPAARPPSSTNA